MAKKTSARSKRRARAAKPVATRARSKTRKVTPVTFGAWVKRVRTFANAAKQGGAATGACLLPDPAGGPAMCMLTDRDTCKTMGGTFVGGSC
jgi:hypothetical protein